MATSAAAVTGACPVCDASLRATRHDWVLCCPDCGYLASTLKATIEQSAAEGRLDEERREAALGALRRKNFEVILDRPPVQTRCAAFCQLDVGSAHGWFLDAAARRGYTACGVSRPAD
jgi:hypothetical protein